MRTSAIVTDLSEKRRELCETFECYAEKHREALLRGALARTRNYADAEDLVQETMVRAFRFFHRFEPGSNFMGWTTTIMRNVFITNYRKSKRRPTSVDMETLELMMGADNSFEDVVRTDFVEHALKKLPLPYREILRLSDMKGLKYREIAEVLNVPVGTVMSRLFRARRLLRDAFEESAA